MRKLILFIALVVGFGALWGCSTDECAQNKNALPYAGFYNSSDPTKTVSIDSLEVYGAKAPGDSILFAGKNAISRLYLPFRIDRDTTTYVFRYLHKVLEEADIRDTVRFIYTRNPRFVSSACGVSYVFDMVKIEHSTEFIDSVVCPMNMIDNKDSENLKIYFRVQTEESGTL